MWEWSLTVMGPQLLTLHFFHNDLNFPMLTAFTLSLFSKFQISNTLLIKKRLLLFISGVYWTGPYKHCAPKKLKVSFHVFPIIFSFNLGGSVWLILLNSGTLLDILDSLLVLCVSLKNEMKVLQHIHTASYNSTIEPGNATSSSWNLSNATSSGAARDPAVSHPPYNSIMGP